MIWVLAVFVVLVLVSQVPCYLRNKRVTMERRVR